MWNSETSRKRLLVLMILLLPHFVNPLLALPLVFNAPWSEFGEGYRFALVGSFLFIGPLYFFVSLLWLVRQRGLSADATLSATPRLYMIFNAVAFIYFLFLTSGRGEDLAHFTLISLACSSVNFFLIMGFYRLISRPSRHA